MVRLVSTSQSIFVKEDGVKKSKEPSKKYSNTLFLPKTTFPVRVEGKKRTEEMVFNSMPMYTPVEESV